MKKWIDDIYLKMVYKPLTRVYLFIYNIRTYGNLERFLKLVEICIRARKSHKSHKSFLGAKI